MIPRSKKRCKSMQQDDDNAPPEEDLFYRNPPRNVLAALDERISQLERGGRSRRKRKSTVNCNTCTSHRPCSVPSKNVSFSPAILNRGEHKFIGDRNDSAWRNKCSLCEIRGPRSTMSTSPCKKKLSMNSTENGPHADSSESVSSDYDSPQYYADVCSSPGPARYCGDPPRCRGDFKHAWGFGAERTSRSEDCYPGAVSTFYSSGLRRKYPYFYPIRTVAKHVLGSSYAATNTQDAICRFGGNSMICLPTNDSWKTDFNVDLLLAKYREYSHSNSLSSPTSYFPYKSSFLGTGRPIDNMSNNKPTLRNLTPSSITPSRTHRIRSNALTLTPVSSRYNETILNPLTSSDPLYYDYNKSLNCCYDFSIHQPFGIKTCMNSSLPWKNSFKSHRATLPLVSTLPKAMPEIKDQTKFDMWILPWLQNKASTSVSKFTLTHPSPATTFSNRIVRSADSADDATFQGGHLYGTTAAHNSSGSFTSNLCYRHRLYLNGSTILSDLSTNSNKNALYSNKYHRPTTTTEDECDGLSVGYANVYDIPKYQHYAKSYSSNNSTRFN